MPIHDLYSKRQKKIRGEVPEVFQYEIFPEPFRRQIIYILGDLFNPISIGDSWLVIHRILCREYGVAFLSESLGLDAIYGTVTERQDVESFLLECEDVEKVLDVIEISFKLIYCNLENLGFESKEYLDEEISEINARFLEHGLGYQFESNEIIRVDSKFIHNEVVKLALTVLTGDMYKGANDEFLKAHEHYRHGRYKECLNECLKSFESTMKAICTECGWTYNDNDTAKRLIDICLQNNLIPDYLQSQFTSLRSSLESGIPTVRNRTSGHGQGSDISEVPSYLASYLLHLTATTILLLADAEKALA
jgi:hypothetical protein